jgi:hypothetical protein
MRGPSANPLILFMMFFSAIALAIVAYQLISLLLKVAGG